MSKVDIDEVREDRIMDEALVDAYGREERVMGWYYYLDDKISVPFKAKCIEERSISPLQVDEEVEISGLAPPSDCDCEIFVMLKWQNRKFGVPLAQLAMIDGDEDTQEAVEDWYYWVKRGYEF